MVDIVNIDEAAFAERRHSSDQMFSEELIRGPHENVSSRIHLEQEQRKWKLS